MPPTRIGTPIASEAATMPAWTPTSVKGSTAVEFSGQTTRSGRGSSPAATSRGQLLGERHVVGGDLAVHGQHVGAVARHVALHGGHGQLLAGVGDAGDGGVRAQERQQGHRRQSADGDQGGRADVATGW